MASGSANDSALSQLENFQCPYDPSHIVKSLRAQTHLAKCRINHPNTPKVECPFNTTHVVNNVELDYHMSTCPDRDVLERYKHSNEQPGRRKAPTPPLPPQFESAECWDDVDVPSYNPRDYAKNALVVRHVQGVPPSARKQFREEERLRLNKLKK